jgi:hypothetical protein
VEHVVFEVEGQNREDIPETFGALWQTDVHKLLYVTGVYSENNSETRFFPDPP